MSDSENDRSKAIGGREAFSDSEGDRSKAIGGHDAFSDPQSGDETDCGSESDEEEQAGPVLVGGRGVFWSDEEKESGDEVGNTVTGGEQAFSDFSEPEDMSDGGDGESFRVEAGQAMAGPSGGPEVINTPVPGPFTNLSFPDRIPKSWLTPRFNESDYDDEASQ